MANKDGDPTTNRPPLFHILMMGNNKQVYLNSVLDKFFDEFFLLPSTMAMDSPVSLMHHDADRSWITDSDPDHPQRNAPLLHGSNWFLKTLV